MKRLAALALAGLGCGAPTPGAWAQAPGTELESCVVAAAGSDDRRALVQWMFSAMALHPDLAGLANVSDERRGQANRDMAATLERLLVVDCAEQTRRALHADSAAMAAHRAFLRVAQLAGESLFEDPAVATAGSGVVGQVDMDRIARLLAP